MQRQAEKKRLLCSTYLPASTTPVHFAEKKLPHIAPNLSTVTKNETSFQEQQYIQQAPSRRITTTSIEMTEPPQTPLTPMSPSFPEPCFQTAPASPTSSISSTSTVTDNHSTTISDRITRLRAVPQIHRRRRERPSLLNRRFTHMVRQLQPLLSIETGAAHPRFPRNMLQYNCLTEKELDDLANFYHQREPSQFSMQYPMPIVSRWDAGPTNEEVNTVDTSIVEMRAMMGLQTSQEDLQSLLRVNRKRRRFGRFMGLQGMESPGLDMEATMREMMEQWVEREMVRRDLRDRELEAWRSKGF